MLTSRFYYSKLDDAGKIVYKAIYKAYMENQNSVAISGIGLSASDFQWICECVRLDNPYIFDTGHVALYSAGSYNWQLQFTNKIKSLSHKELADAVNHILSRMPNISGMSDFDKELFVHDYLCQNCRYAKDDDRDIVHTAYGAIVLKNAVCDGIAKAVKLLLNMLDVPCIVVTGKFKGNGHAWNIVKINGRAYQLDVTMDNQSWDSNCYDCFNLRDVEMAGYQADQAGMLPACIDTRDNYFVRRGGYVFCRKMLNAYVKRCLRRREKAMYVRLDRRPGQEYEYVSFKKFMQDVGQAVHVAGKDMSFSMSYSVCEACEAMTYSFNYVS